MSRLIDLTGQRFGRLTALELLPREEWRTRGRAEWRCRCACGAVVRGQAQALRAGKLTSCGAGACRAKPNLQHGMRGTAEYRAWSDMKSRCTNPRHVSWSRYGGRGITVCSEWAGPDGFAAFLAHIGPRPAWATGGIDRIDNDGNYEPGNVRWATVAEQRANRSRRAT